MKRRKLFRTSSSENPSALPEPVAARAHSSSGSVVRTTDALSTTTNCLFTRKISMFDGSFFQCKTIDRDEQFPIRKHFIVFRQKKACRARISNLLCRNIVILSMLCRFPWWCLWLVLMSIFIALSCFSNFRPSCRGSSGVWER